MLDEPTLTKLDELISAIRAASDPRHASEWKQVFKLLDKAGVLDGHGKHVVGMRDLDGLIAMRAQFGATDEELPEGDATFDDAELKKAFKAFRKRLSLTVLDEESKLGRSPLTKGHDESHAAITPPIEWPDEVWQELVRQRKLRYAGHGLYGLPKEGHA